MRSLGNAVCTIEEASAGWREWAKCHKQEGSGEWSEAVLRSLITLKALAHRETGGIVAAATTSLPEQLGGARNWDYRFCWLRDATLTLYALLNSGFLEEAAAWRDWLLRAVAGSPVQMQIMYGIAGERRLTEYEVRWLRGYEDAAPVRIGNAAADQLQLDVFGEVLDALYQARRGGIADSKAGWALQRALVRHLEAIWDKPDEGIWEVRGGRQHFTHSKVMAWVAFDRAATLAAATDDGSANATRWRKVADEIHADVCRRGYDPDLGSFVQVFGSKLFDASLLHIPLG